MEAFGDGRLAAEGGGNKQRESAVRRNDFDSQYPTMKTRSKLQDPSLPSTLIPIFRVPQRLAMLDLNAVIAVRHTKGFQPV